MVKSTSSNPPAAAPRPGSSIPRPMARAIPLPSGKKATTSAAPQATTAPMAVQIPAAPALPKIDEAPTTTKTSDEPAALTIRTAEEPAASTTRDPVEVVSAPAASITKIEVSPPTAPLGAMMEAPVALVPTPLPMMAPAALAAPAAPAPVAPAPIAPVPVVAVANPFQAAPEGRSPFTTVADDIDVEMTGDVPAPIAQPATAPLVVPAVVASLAPTNATLASPLLAIPTRAPMVSLPDTAPSKEALLERAAALGPARPTWASFVPTSDPVLEAKMKPQIAERRARFQKIVKGTLAACGAMCLVALIVTAVSGGEPTAKAASRSEGANKTAPTKSVVSVESMAGAKRSKAVRTAAPAVTTAVAMPRAKRR